MVHVFFSASATRNTAQLLIDSEVYCFFDYRSLEIVSLAGHRIREGFFETAHFELRPGFFIKDLINPTHNNNKEYQATSRTFLYPFSAVKFSFAHLWHSQLFSACSICSPKSTQTCSGWLEPGLTLQRHLYVLVQLWMLWKI